MLQVSEAGGPSELDGASGQVETPPGAAGVLGDSDQQATRSQRLEARDVDGRHLGAVALAPGVAEVGQVGGVVTGLFRAEPPPSEPPRLVDDPGIAESDKRRMLAVIDLFREQDTIDELGLSAAWDAFADLLFPGTGTVQTRARYFLFVPWIFQLAEAQRVPSAKARATVRRLEVVLIGSLLAGGANQQGIIGSQAGAQLRRMPSAIYWSGLARLGIRRFQIGR